MTKPLLVFEKIIEKEKRRARKDTKKKVGTAKKSSGSTKYISPAKRSQRRIVKSSVGKKFFLFKICLCLKSFFIIYN